MSSKPFDATFKDLIEGAATSWPAFLGPWPFRSVEVVDADVSTTTAASDKVLLVHADTHDWILHLEIQSSHDSDLPERLHLYNVLMQRRHRLPVRSVVLLLRREANASNLTGELRLQHPDEDEPYDVFRYRVVRLWEQSLEALMAGDLRLLPVVGLSDEAEPVEDVVDRVGKRLRTEATPAEGLRLATSFSLLLGLKYDREHVVQLLARLIMAINIEDSSTVEVFMSWGAVRGVRSVLLDLGKARFGVPDADTRAAIDTIDDFDRLKELALHIQSVSSWQELLTKV